MAKLVKMHLPLVVMLMYSAALKAQPSKETTVFNCGVAETISFPGGYDSLKRFVGRNLRWPWPGRDNEGTVYVRFKVACDGTVSETQVMKGLDSLANAEALRVIRLMPQWKPLDCRTYPQSMWYYCPVRFRLN